MRELFFLFIFSIFSGTFLASDVTDLIIKETFDERLSIGDSITLDRLDSLLKQTNSYKLKAKIYAYKAGILSKNPEKYKDQIDAYMDLSVMSVFNSNSYLAIQSALKAKKIARSFNDLAGLAKSNYCLGSTYLHYTDFEVGLTELNSAKQFYESKPIEYYRDLNLCYGCLMNNYIHHNNYDSAEYFFEKGFNLCNSQNDTLNALFILIPYLSQLIEANKSIEKIDFYLSKLDSLTVNSLNNIHISLGVKTLKIKYKIIASKGLTDVLVDINELEKTIQDNAIQSNLVLSNVLFKTKLMYYEEIGDYKKALSIKHIRDSLKNEINKNKTSSLYLELNEEVDQIEKELLISESEQKLLQSRNELNTYVILFLIMLSAFLISLVLLIIKRRKAKRLFLEEELNKKNRELVSKSLLINEKQKVLEELSTLKNTQINKNEVKSIINTISFDIADYQEDFMKHFNSVHPDFYTKLIKAHPELSKNELKICGYFKMNLTTKEISRILSINPESVKKARYRMRKKMMIPQDIELDHYIQSI